MKTLRIVKGTNDGHVSYCSLMLRECCDSMGGTEVEIWANDETFEVMANTLGKILKSSIGQIFSIAAGNFAVAYAGGGGKLSFVREEKDRFAVTLFLLDEARKIRGEIPLQWVLTANEEAVSDFHSSMKQLAAADSGESELIFVDDQ